MSRSFSPSWMRVLLGAPCDSGKSDFSGVLLAERGGAAPRLSTSPVKSCDSRGSSLELADEDAGATLQYQTVALGALGNHDHPRFGDEEALAVALEVISYLLALGNVDVLVDDRTPNFRVLPDFRVIHDDRILDQAVRMPPHRAPEH